MSREVKAILIDAMFSSLVIILAWFLSSDKLNQALLLVAIWQPVVVALIIGEAQKTTAKFTWDAGYQEGREDAHLLYLAEKEKSE